ncbi:MAG: FtsX-like permease family protein [bacterium]|nr:FtsX-like permease family protein [bacterium]
MTDLRQAWRWLVRRPGMTLLAVLTLALGIGPNTAIFSVVNAVLLTELPFENPDRVVCLWSSTPGKTQERMAGPDLRDIQQNSQSFSQIGGFWATSAQVGEEDLTEELPVAAVTAGLFTALGVEPVLGRSIVESDTFDDAEPVAVLSHELWQRRFRGDPAILGESAMIWGQQHVIVGVVPEGLGPFPTVTGEAVRFEVWTPFEASATAGQVRSFKVFQALARLNPGVSIAEAQAELDGIAQRLEREYPENRSRSFRAVPIEEQIVGHFGTGLMALLGAVGFVLMIAGVNVANLLLEQGVARRKEIATRLAIGATSGRISRPLVLEALLLSLGGGSIGLLLGAWGMRLLVAMAPQGVPRLDEVSLDGSVLSVSAACIVLVAALLAVIPSAQLRGVSLGTALGDRSRESTQGRRGRRLVEGLVIIQIASAAVLLVAASLMIRSFARIVAVNPGFDVDQLLTVTLRVPSSIPSDGMFTRQLEERLHTIAGVENVGIVSFLPFGYPGADFRFAAGGPEQLATAESHYTYLRQVSPRYFTAMGMDIVDGRGFTLDDMATEGPPPVIVSRCMAEEGWGEESPVGQTVTFDIYPRPRELSVVGVVSDLQNASLFTPPQSIVYRSGSRRGRPIFAVVRTSGHPDRVAAAVRTAIQQIDPDITVVETRAMRDIVLASVATPRFVRWLAGVLSGLATLLALVGVYGVMACNTARRGREIGVRMALGASPLTIGSRVLRRGLGLAAIGAVVGLVGALVVTRWLGALLYEMSAVDPPSFAVGIVLLLVAVLLACGPLAFKAARTDPLAQLRSE